MLDFDFLDLECKVNIDGRLFNVRITVDDDDDDGDGIVDFQWEDPADVEDDYDDYEDGDDE